MILKRFITLSIFAKQQSTHIPVSLFISTKTQSQAQPSTIVEQQVVDEAPHQEQAQHDQTQLTQQKQSKHQGFGGKMLRKNRSRGDSQFSYDEEGIVNQFLVSKKQPQLNLARFFQQLKPNQTQEQIKRKFAQFQAQYQKQQGKKLQAYQRRLNLTPQKIISANIKLNSSASYGSKNRNFNPKFVKNDTIKNLTFSEVKQHYINGLYSEIIDNDFIRQVFRIVGEQKQRSFLLNLVYQHLKNKQKVTLSAHQINKILDLVASGQFSGVNSLKFYWLAQKVTPNLRSSISSLILSQFKKIRVNGKNASKDLISTSYFFLGSQLSTKIVSRICQISKSLNKAIRLWFLTVLIASRIKKFEQLSQSQNVLNLNDIFVLQKQNQTFKNYFNNQLPKLLFQSNSVNIYQAYRKSLKQTQHLNNTSNVLKSQLQNNLGLNLTEKDIYLEYLHEKDFNSQKIWLTKKQSVKQFGFNSQDYNLVQNIIKGQYQSVLNYYANNIANSTQDSQQIYRYLKQARRDFNDSNSQALYTLKQLFKNSKTKFDPQNHCLTQQKYKKFATFKNYASTSTKSTFKQSKQTKSFSQNRNNAQKPLLRQKAQPTADKQVPQQKQQRKKGLFKEKRQSKPLFGKKPNNSFCSVKDQLQQAPSKEQSNLHYQNYLKTVKETEKSVESLNQQSKLNIFNFNECKTLEEVQQQFKKHLNQINQNNILQIIKEYQNVPIVGNINALIKYFFLSTIPNNQPAKQIKIEFASSFGQVSKDYGQYLKGCSFMFPLPNQLYDEILIDLGKKNQRHKFKRVAAHLLLYKNNISDFIVAKICEICSKEKIGLTLLQIINLMNTKQIQISYQSLKKIASSIQNFKNMESDLLNFVRKYCDRTNIKIQTKLFEPYIANLTFTQRYEALNGFFDILRQQFKTKQYKIDSKFSAQQNLKAEKVYKQIQSERANNELLEMVRIVAASFKPRTTIPPFVIQIFEQYLSKKKGPMKANQFAIGTIVYSQSQEKFLKLLQNIKANPSQNTEQVLDSQIRALLLFGRALKDQAQKMLKATLFQKQFDLNESQLRNLGLIFKDLDIPGAYSEYLQYVLKKQPKITQEIKNLYYRIFNSTTDDFSKNQISGLLDYIFNPTKEKERIQYKKVKEQEERKSKILKSLGAKKQKQLQEEMNKEQQNKVKVEKKTQTDSVAKDKKKTKKEQKKDKKQQKKQKSQQKKSSDNKTDKSVEKLGQNQLPADTKVNVFEKNLKRQAKYLSKMSSTLTYDQNAKIVFHSKLWSRDLRTKATTLFIQNFMQKYELNNDDQKADKQSKLKKGKGGKQTPKQTSKKSATKQKK